MGPYLVKFIIFQRKDNGICTYSKALFSKEKIMGPYLVKFINFQGKDNGICTYSASFTFQGKDNGIVFIVKLYFLRKKSWDM